MVGPQLSYVLDFISLVLRSTFPFTVIKHVVVMVNNFLNSRIYLVFLQRDVNSLLLMIDDILVCQHAGRILVVYHNIT